MSNNHARPLVNPLPEQRVARVRAKMEQQGWDALVLTYGSHFQYVTGLETPIMYDNERCVGDHITALVLPLTGDPVFIVRPGWLRDHVEGMPFEVRAWDAGRDGGDHQAFLAQQVATLGLDGKRIAVPKTTWAQTLLAYQQALPNATFAAVTDTLIDEVRSIKDADELEIMQEASAITDRAFSAVVAQMQIGMLDRDLTIEIDYQLKKAGGDASSFPPTVVLDGHGSRWARNWTDRTAPQPITAGMTVAFDFGVMYRGYASDFGRSVFIGEARDEPLRAWRSITNAIQVAMGAMGDGKLSPLGVHDLVVETVGADGFRDQFSWWALGHSIGMDVHENPWMLPAWTEPVKAGMCFALEPKIGRPGQFYVRCEDVCVVGADAAHSLTRSTYEPIIIG